MIAMTSGPNLLTMSKNPEDSGETISISETAPVGFLNGLDI